ncbi:YdiU family protein [Geobacillus zalihae]|uniref:protein adenylyltransferase SelO n=1 Tax=Geobacillus zalihae TaxID=213419 RepID=UPI0007642A78|nr:YdiU family protein [Geobacillus zalihae]WKA47858.1 YdiU family protein [Geobacillus zalihae]
MLDAGWKFDNSYARLPERFFSNVLPTPVRAPKLAVLNRSLAAELGLNEEALRSEDGVVVLAGNKIPDGAEPLAQAYAGHQFGYFTMLGDGRAVLLGEHVTPSGERVDIQLKGSGRTPYSRGGDGRAALGPMLREYIVSEAMHALGIPTTRSLAVVTTGETIMRETELPGAVLARVASSHLRVGTFQYAAQWGTAEELRALADYALWRHFPGFEEAENRYLFLLEQVIERQAALIAKWQLVGFVHGVMNTDNMTISGETIDYGPCAFMDTYDPATVFSSIDTQGRYAYGNQPYIGGWNLARFAESLLPLLDENEEKAIALAQGALDHYPKQYHDHWLSGMRAKLGLAEEQEGDQELIADLLRLMELHRADYTNTFRALTLGEYTGMALFDASEFREWHERWQTRLSQESASREEAYERMRRHNPAVIPRNHRVEEALAAAVNGGDYSVMNRLLQALSDPYAYSPEQEKYAELPPPSDRPYRTFCGT